MTRPVVIAAGGTGGHFFPAEALAAELLSRGMRVCLMTDRRPRAFASQVFAGCETVLISSAGVFGRGLLRGTRAIAALLRGVAEARIALLRIDATVLVGFGGYPTVAPVLASRLLRRRPRVVLHDQNAVLGRANRFLTRFADVLALSHAETRHARSTGIAVTGNPVRAEIIARRATPPRPTTGRIALLVLGGSQGARIFSDVVPPALALLPDALQRRLDVTQQCRPEDLERVRQAYAVTSIAVELAPFFEHMADRLAGAHLVVARSGASTVAELAVIGRPAILVPLPGAIDDDQTANAEELAAVGAAWIVKQRDFSPDALAIRLQSLLAAPQTLADAARAAATCGRPQAASRLADLVESLCRKDAAA